MRCLISAAAAFCLLAAPMLADAAAGAAVAPRLAYSNLGAGGAFGSGYYFVSGPVNTALTYAAPFVAGVSGYLDHIDLPLAPQSANAGVVVSIFPDKDGVPGTYADGPPLHEWLDTKLPGPATLVKFISNHNPSLVAGAKYWIVVAPVYYDSVVAWYQNTTSQSGVDATTGGGANQWSAYTANGSVAPAFDVWVH